MKIALLTSFFEPIGGQETVTKLLFEMLRNVGHDVDVITTRSLWFNYNNIIKLDHLSSVPKKMLMPGTLLTDYMMSISIARALKERNPELIHVQDEFLLPAVILANKHLRLPCICSCHNNIFSYSKEVNSIRDHLLSMFFRIRKRNYIKCLRKVDAIISVSNYIRKELICAGLESNKIHTIYNVHISSSYRNDSVKLLSQSPQIVLFALGRLVWYKGFDVLLSAMKIVTEQEPYVKLIIAGSGPEMEYLKGLVKNYQLESCVVLVGRVSEDELTKFYRTSDVVLLPSIYPDPAPLVTMEAMSFGKPIIASNIGGIPEAVIDGVNGLLVTPNDFKETAETILKLIRNRELRISMGESGRAILRKKFKNKELVAETVKLYKKVLHQSQQCI